MNLQRNFSGNARNAGPSTIRSNHPSEGRYGDIKGSNSIYRKRYLPEDDFSSGGMHHQPPAKRLGYEETNKTQFLHNNCERKLQGCDYQMGFKNLESVSKMENCEDVLKEISAKKPQLLLFLDRPYNLDDCDKYVLLLKIFSKIAKSAFIEIKSQLLMDITKSKFCDNLEIYLTKLPYQTEIERKRNRFLWNDLDEFWHNFLAFCENLHILSPSCAFQKCRALVDLAITLCLPFLGEKHNLKLSEEHTLKFEAMKNKFSIYEGQPKETKDYGRVPDDFRTLSLFPTAEDLLQTKPFVRPNIIDGSYENVEHYLDVQFRLLREDCYGPLRIGLQQFRKDATQRKYDNVRVYRNVVMVEPTMVQNQFGTLVQWDTTKRKYSKNIKWEQSKRLMFGSLLVFVQDNNFRNLIIGTVLNRDAKLLSEGLVVVQLYNVHIYDRKFYGASYSMLESQVYFEPYLHVLRALQDPKFPEHLAMSKYIVKVDHVPGPPDYLTKTTLRLHTRNGPVKFTVLDNATWPDRIQLGLNESQYIAFKSALTQEFVVIQGPPGTGKTYLGVLIVRTLLEHFNGCLVESPSVSKHNSNENKTKENCSEAKSSFNCRLLVLCYTNHALDQFLGYICPITQSIVRIGGQSRNPDLDKFNLKNKRRNEINFIFKHARHNLEDANSELTVFQRNVNIFNDGVYSYDSIKTVSPDVIFIKGYPGTCNDPLLNWLFEHADDVKNVFKIKNIDSLQEVECDEDNAILSLDDVGVDADRRLFYENESDIKSSFLIENCNERLKRFIEMYNNPENNYARKLEIQIAVNHHRSCLFLFQEMQKNRNQLTKINIKDRRHAYQFTTEERWSIYFQWAAKLKEKLLRGFQLLKQNQEKKFVAYEEARMMMDLEILRRATVVGVTTTGAARIRKLLQALQTPIVIVEEAAEVLEAHIIAALTKHCQHLILIGDHQQLRPSAAHYKLARHFNMEVSLFERMVNTGARAVRLRMQHRMRPEIAALVSPAIYPDLQTHPSMLCYSPVRGLTVNLFFFTHDNREEFEEELLSRSNHFEADMLLGLANYIMQQGYETEDVTILTTYATQMFYMRKNRFNYRHLHDIKITLVDKYQGEESKIILLSLVRNNNEGEVGFLVNDNRVCVALSRAKEGLYIMGNMDMLKNKSELWKKIAATLESYGSLGTSFSLKCQQHPDNIMEVRSPDDFLKVPEGGCMQKCKKILGCGHCCPLMCHLYDEEHAHVVCNEKCIRLCQLSHPCNKKCSTPCPPCKVLVKKELPCKHTAETFCYVEPNDIKCLEKVTAKLPTCGHKVNKICYEQNARCLRKCNLRLGCGHTCRQKCHVTNDPEHEQYNRCKQKCTRKKSGCTAVFADDDDFGSHNCSKLCYQECDACDVKVTKEISDCGHKAKVACSAIPTRQDCVQDCEKVLRCGHNCIMKCAQECSCNKTTLVPKPLLCGHNIVSCESYNKDLHTLGESMQSLRMCMASCDALLACGHLCAGTCVRCRQGRLHVPCVQPCERTLICGHLCEEKCNGGCPPCDKRCEVGCAHNRCPEKCGMPCVPCKEPCSRVCPHGVCPLKCGAPCARKSCNERCPLTLSCGHRCRGLCGELCPLLCAICSPDAFPTPLFGDHYEDNDLFIVLQDCGHSMEVTEADMMMQSKPDGEVHIRSCPICRKPIINTSRYKDIVNDLLKNEINPIKRQLYGDKIQIIKTRSEVGKKFLKIALYSRDVRVHDETLTHCCSILNYIRMNKKLSLPRLNVLTTILEIFEIIFEYVKQYLMKDLTEFKDYFMDIVNILMSTLTENLKTISEQQQLDINNEIKRLRCVLQLAILVTSSTYKSVKHIPAVGSAYKVAVDAVTTWRVFDEAVAVDALKELETVSKASGIVTKEERDLVVRALGMRQGHWFKCPNGHFYCIGECGGAMERSRCPDCGATIGGENHALDSSNRHAGELDGSRYPAWSAAANMANYRI